jgi:glycosyltransferase involved in cell wall biosynthesis
LGKNNGKNLFAKGDSQQRDRYFVLKNETLERTPKVAYLLGSINRGGLETLMLDVFRHAEKNGLPAICIYRKDGTLKDEYEKAGIRVKKISPSRNFFKYLMELRKEIVDNNVKIAHAQQLHDAFYAWLALRGTKISIVSTLHGYDYNVSKLIFKRNKFILNHTDLNLFVSNEQKNYYTERYRLKRQNRKVVYNGISFEKFDQSKYSNIRDEFGIPNDILLLGSVGNFVHGRDQFTLCCFLNLLHKNTDIDFRFLFVGLDANKKRYNACVSYIKENGLDDKVLFIGGRTDVPNILFQLDAFLYSTDHDTFGLAVIEAMYAGLPVFVNDWGVMIEITQNGTYVNVYKTKDEYDLLEKFEDFLKNRQQYMEKAMCAKSYVIENYSIDNYIEKLKIIYENLEKNKLKC